MKRIFPLLFLLLLCLCLSAPCACAQEIMMEDVFASIEFPDTWLVLSPQLLSVYEPVLSRQGFDITGMAERYASEGVVAEAWDESYAQSMRVMVTVDERSKTLFTLDRATQAERNSMLRYYQTRSNFSATAYRYQQAEWQTHSQYGRFLFLRYHLVDDNGNITERGVRYFTIYNGMNFFIDWTIPDRRFTNRDLSSFKGILESLTFTDRLDAPALPASLSADIPAEVASSTVEISGSATPQAGIVVALSSGEGESQDVSIGSADENGRFSIFFELPGEGTYVVTLTATKSGYADTSLRQTLVYQSSLIPVTIDAWPDTPWTEDTFTLSGQTLAGAQLQLITDKGLVTKKPNAQGRFSFELNTPEEGVYTYTLVVNYGKYTQRRFPFTIQRVFTQSEELARLRRSAQNISYRNLVRKSAQYQGAVMRLSGYISEISPGDGVCFIRLMLSRDSKGVWGSPVVIACEGEQPPTLNVGERGVVYGSVSAPYYEQNANGEDVTVPGFTFICVDK